MPCKKVAPCGPRQTKFKLQSGKTCCRKKSKSVKSRAKKTTKRSVKLDFSLSDAKNKLRAAYSVNVNGAMRAPKFITTLEGVTGSGAGNKIANLRRVLSSCKKMGVPLVKEDGKFKKYRTLVRQCGVTFKTTPGIMSLSNLLAKRRARRGAGPPALPAKPDYLRPGYDGMLGPALAFGKKRLVKLDFSLADAKNKLRATYSVNVNGAMRAPKFITTLEGVTGSGAGNKIANLRRVLSSCKKMGVPLVKEDGKFKKYRTLVRQCGVTFKTTPGIMSLSNLLAKRRARRPASPPSLPAKPYYLKPGYEGILGPEPDLINLSAFGRRYRKYRGY